MKTVWMLTILFMPAGNEGGLLMGWTQPYPTQLDCRIAQARAMVDAGRGPKMMMLATCTET